MYLSCEKGILWKCFGQSACRAVPVIKPLIWEYLFSFCYWSRAGIKHIVWNKPQTIMIMLIYRDNGQTQLYIITISRIRNMTNNNTFPGRTEGKRIQAPSLTGHAFHPSFVNVLYWTTSRGVGNGGSGGGGTTPPF